MHKQEVDEFFNVSCGESAIVEETENLFFKMLSEWQETQGSIAIHLMRRYKKSYSEEFKDIILKYTALLLLNPELASQKDKIILAGPTVIIPHFNELDHVLNDLSRLEEYEQIYAPILYKIGIKAVSGEPQKYLGMLRSILSLPNVYKIFTKKYAWGLEICQHNCYISFNYLYTGKKDHKKDSNDLIVHAAVIDPFLEPFLYAKNEDGCSMLLNKQPYQLRELSISLVKGMLDYQYDLYSLLLNLIKRDPLIKAKFITWLRTIYLKNKERNKMMYDRSQFISDGYAFNLNGVLGNFSKGIIEKEMMNFDLAWFSEEKVININKGEKGHCKFEEQKNTEEPVFTFQTAIFLSKVILGNLSFTKMLEKMSEFSMRLSYLEGENSATTRVLQTMVNACRVVLYSEISTLEIPFLHYMSAYALEHPVPGIFLSFYLNLAEFLVRNFDFGPNPEFCTRILESSEFNLHSKVPAVKIIFYSGIKIRAELLVKFYIDIEKLEAGERKGVRYYLNKILADYKIGDLKFINCVLSDLETLLSTGLGALMELKKKYTSKTVQQARSSFFCLAELFKLLRKLIETNPSIFLQKEILPQFVTILNYNLKIIVGPKCSELKCPEAKTSLGFEPKEFLREMLMFYMKMLEHSDSFLVAVVKDMMYFNLSLFKRALKICDAKLILNGKELEKLASMTKKAEVLVADNVEEDLIVPEQFIDPVTCVPMKNPVRLKTSNATIDKSTFDILLMNSRMDPFSREALATDGYVIDEELKKEIDEYWAGRT